MPDTAPEKAPTPETAPIVIELEDAMRGLREAVAEKGADHVYQQPDESHRNCVYVWPDENGVMLPRCIAGYALAKVGVPADLMYRLANDMSVHALAERLRPNGYHITFEAVTALRTAQIVQDASVGSFPQPTEDCNWGAALRAAEGYYAKVLEARAKAAHPAHGDADDDAAANDGTATTEQQE